MDNIRLFRVLLSSKISKDNIRKANLSEAKYNEYTFGINIMCPEEGEFIGYKKASYKIVVLKITKDSLRSSSTSLKCRCSKAKVIRFEDLKGNVLHDTEIKSDYDKSFIYKIGRIVKVNNFDTDRWNECSSGIHFFMNKQMAINYNN